MLQNVLASAARYCPRTSVRLRLPCNPRTLASSILPSPNTSTLNDASEVQYTSSNAKKLSAEIDIAPGHDTSNHNNNYNNNKGCTGWRFALLSSLIGAIAGGVSGALASNKFKERLAATQHKQKLDDAAANALAFLKEATELLWLSQQSINRRDSRSAFNYAAIASSKVAEAEKYINMITNLDDRETARSNVTPHAIFEHFHSAIAYTKGWIELLIEANAARALMHFNNAHSFRQQYTLHASSSCVKSELDGKQTRITIDSHSTLQEVVEALKHYELVSPESKSNQASLPNYWSLRHANNFSMQSFARGCDKQAADLAAKVKTDVDALVSAIDAAWSNDDQMMLKDVMSNKDHNEMINPSKSFRKLAQIGCSSVVDLLQVMPVAEIHAIGTQLTDEKQSIRKVVLQECVKRVKKITRKALTIRLDTVVFAAMPSSPFPVSTMADALLDLLSCMSKNTSKPTDRTTLFELLNGGWYDREGKMRFWIAIAAGLTKLSTDKSLPYDMRTALREQAMKAIQQSLKAMETASTCNARDTSLQQSDWKSHCLNFLHAQNLAAAGDKAGALRLVNSIIDCTDTCWSELQPRALRVIVEACLLLLVSSDRDDIKRDKAKRVLQQSLNLLSADSRLKDIAERVVRDPSALNDEVIALHSWWTADVDNTTTAPVSESDNKAKVTNILEQLRKL